MGTETPRNGVLAQYLEFVTKMTNKRRPTLQRIIGAAMVLGPLCLALLLAVALVVVVVTGALHVPMVLLSVVAAMVSGGGMMVMFRRGHERMGDLTSGSTVATEPRQNSVSNETCTECGEAANEDRHEVSDGAG